ncbi:MAG: PEGA domain-containing protein [Polyangiaceae bacterium]|jgi:hypothetical protein|nr:PEGA domain-containing protein [Polyangiaceae bacterium]
MSVTPVAAQTKPPTPADQAVDASSVQAAREHYDRGLKLYDEGAYDAARVEFGKAYDLAPSYRLLYNLGLVHKQLVDYVNALKSFERYLAEGGAAIPDGRRIDVAKEVQELKARIGRVRIKTNVPGAEIFVDDVPVGRSPFAGDLLVNPGNRKVSATKAGRNAASKLIQVAGSDTIDVSLDLLENRTLIIVEKAPRRVPWFGWGTTAVLAAGAGVTGYFALQNSSDLKKAKESPNPDVDDLDSKASSGRALGITADVLTVGAVVAGGLSLYYTIKWGKESNQEAPAGAAPPRASLRFQVQPQGVGLAGTF